jgi:hypothetical protein
LQSWYPDKAISWIAVDESLKWISYTNHEHKFGMGVNANVYEQYLISFYWVATTVTSNGLDDPIKIFNIVKMNAFTQTSFINN